MAEAIPLNKEQRSAVDAGPGSVAVSAGAGAGKTTVLTARILKTLESGLNPSQVLALTFTEKAARSMREKLRTTVRAMAEESESWAVLEPEIDKATITTFHSFCSTIVRRFVVQAGIDPAFVPLEPAIASTIRHEAVTDTLRIILLNKESPEHEALRQLIILYSYSQVLNAIDNLVTHPDRAGWQKFLQQSPEKIAEHWYQKDYRALAMRRAEHLLANNRHLRECLNLLRMCESGMTGPAKARTQVILALLPTLPQLVFDTEQFKRLKDTVKVVGTGSEMWGDSAIYEQVKENFTQVRKVLEDQLMDAFTADVTEDLPATAAVAQMALKIALKADDRYRVRKRVRAGIDFADMISIAQELLETNADLCKELREDYPAILVDECQDTDPAQDAIIRAILGGDINGVNLFAVGDSKQSIYRFRGAEVELFDRLKTDVQQVLPLSTNYRSGPRILDFVNHVFNGHMSAYEPLKVAEKNKSLEAEVELILLPVPKDSEESLFQVEAEAIAMRIRELTTQTPKVELKQIAILMKRMTHVGVYERALEEAGLDFYTVGGRAFFAQQEVYDLLNILAVIENPQDSVCLVGVLRSPFGGLSDDAVHVLAMHKDSVWAGLQDTARVSSLAPAERTLAEQIFNTLTILRTEKDRLPITQLLTRIFDLTGYDGSLQFETLADRKLANLWKLIDIARPFDAAGLGLPAFIADLSDRVSTEAKEEQAATSPEEADVVRIMTIHQAKGLEFHTVFVPDLNVKPHGGNHPAVRWDAKLGGIPKLPKDIEDEDPTRPFSPLPHQLAKVADALAEQDEDLRVFYVACTRAERHLVLSAAYKGDNLMPTSVAMNALMNTYDVATGQPQGNETAPVLKLTIPQRLKRQTQSQSVVPLAKPQPMPEIQAKYSGDEIALNVIEGRMPTIVLLEPEELSNAKQILRSVAFTYPLSGTVITGHVDWLWEDGNGWHVAVANEDATVKRLPGLRLAAEAIQKGSGIAIATLRVFDVATATWKQTTLDAMTVEAAETFIINKLKTIH